MEWLIGLVNYLLRRKTPKEMQPPQLDLIAVITTPSVDQPGLEGAIRQLLISAKHSAELVMFAWDTESLMEELQVRNVAFIVIVDSLPDLEESCELLNAINTFPTLAKIPFKTLTALESQGTDQQTPNIGPLDEMLLQILTSKRS